MRPAIPGSASSRRRSPAALLGAFTALACSLARVNDIAMGIAIMLAGTGIAFFFGKPYVQPSAPQLPVIPLGFWSDQPQIRSALDVCPLFFLGLLVAVLHGLGVQEHTRRPCRADRRRQRRCRPGDGPAHRPHPARRDGGRQRAGRCRRRVPVAVLSGQLERGPVVRPGADGGGAGRVRALEPARLRRRRRCCSAPRARSAPRCRPSASPRATTCSTPRPTC